MSGEEKHDTEELRLREAQLEAEEREQAREAESEDEAHTHERRADKAAYLREKLEERARSEREE
jgi:hypothetical protein